ncbi:MAG: hypothetical protein ABI197_02275 [Granulicella sp.]
MQGTILMVSGAECVEHCATAIAEQLQLTVEIAGHRRAALAAVRRVEYSVILVEESLAESDPAWADLLAQNAGFALSMQINFATTGCARLVREVRSMLLRREHDRVLARQSAVTALQSELKSSVTGLLLHSELALREPSVPAALAPKLRHLVELAGVIRQQLHA